MASSKKSFWESLGETLTIYLVILLIIGIIKHLFDFLKDVINGDKTKLVKLVIWVFFIYLIWFNYPKNNRNSTYNPPPPSKYDNMSGQEIWNEKMKNYDPERGY